MQNKKARGGSVHEIYELFDALGEKGHFDLLDPRSSEKFTNEIRRLFEKGRHQPQFGHGKRVEAMFEFVAASLKKCQLIKKEDSGSYFTPNGNERLQPPDYLVVTPEGQQVLVEVKNHHSAPLKPWSIRLDDLQALQRYAGITQRSLYFAIFWSRHRMWTLIPDSILTKSKVKAGIDFITAMKSNHMSILGDLMIATTPPLTCRVNCDTSRPRSVGPSGLASFTIGSVDLLCAGRKLKESVEQKIAWYVLLFGDWVCGDWKAIFKEDDLDAVELDCDPMEPVEGQNFQFIGSLSSLMSRHYDALTIHEGEIAKHRAGGSSDQLGVVIPHDYEGVALPLWRFRLEPNLE